MANRRTPPDILARVKHEWERVVLLALLVLVLLVAAPRVREKISAYFSKDETSVASPGAVAAAYHPRAWTFLNPPRHRPPGSVHIFRVTPPRGRG
mgnify:FL=1